MIDMRDMKRPNNFPFDKLTGGVGNGVGSAVVGGLVGTGADVGCVERYEQNITMVM